MAPFGVFVSLVEPGFIRTELFGRNRQIAAGALSPDSSYREIFLRLEAFTDQQVRSAGTPASAVAEAILRAVTSRSPRIRYVVGRRARFLLSLRRHLPGEFFDRIWIREITKRLSEAKSTQ
jgi:NAD(P)-dependent dehydrogenase (short-subunit alcohol dehydrogenase family)